MAGIRVNIENVSGGSDPKREAAVLIERRLREAVEDIIPKAAKLARARYSDGELITSAGEAYGLRGPLLRKVAKDPRYLEMVRTAIEEQQTLIAKMLRNIRGGASTKDAVRKTLGNLSGDSKIAVAIGKDHGGIDWHDILISVQRHRVVAELLQVRDDLSAYLRRKAMPVEGEDEATTSGSVSGFIDGGLAPTRRDRKKSKRGVWIRVRGNKGVTTEAEDGFVPPGAVRKEAQKGLDLRREWKRGGLSNKQGSKEGIGSGVQRAVNLKNGDSVSLETVKRMHAFFSRHRSNFAPDKKESDGGPTAGTIAWYLWGGTPGWDWAKSILKKHGEL